MELKPLSDRVVVRLLDEEERTPGGIYLPDTAKERPQKGQVVAVGPGRVTDEGQRLEMVVQVGDTVLFGKYAGTEIVVDGDEYLILRESEILAVVKE